MCRMMLGCVSAILLICIVTAIVGYVVYRRHMAWKRSPGIDSKFLMNLWPAALKCLIYDIINFYRLFIGANIIRL